MAELLLEILSEEIPARMQARAAEDLKRLVTAALKDAGLEFESAEAYVTPRRLTLVVDGLPEKQPDIREEKRGPKVGAPEEARKGFVRSVGASEDSADILLTIVVDGDSVSLPPAPNQPVEIEVSSSAKSTPSGDYFFTEIKQKGRDTGEVIGEFLPGIIWNFSWPKSMRWGAGKLRWVRPIHSIVCLLDGRIITLAIEPQTIDEVSSFDAIPALDDIGGGIPHGIKTGNTTRGHRFLAPVEIKVKDFKDYEAKLKKAKVILDAAQRRAKIERDARALAKKAKLTLKADGGLLDEVAGLVEWPVALIGVIDEDFMALPPDVLITAMRSHQKYFALEDANGAMAPHFITIADNETADGGKDIVAGNERVLRARLADAKFFWDQDRKVKLESRVAKLAEVVFHAKLGTVAEKAGRMEALAAGLCQYVPGADEKPARTAASLSKADLVTAMVAEFPELQGVMGCYYALGDGVGEDTALAIAEHYAPLGPRDECPKAPLSVAVALADKIDTLAGLFAIDEKPTGSRDPFALRRAALGVIRLIVENGLRLPLTKVFETHYGLIDSAIHRVESRRVMDRKPEEGELQVFAPPEQPEEFERRKTKVSSELMDFFAERLKVRMRAHGVRHDLIAAAFAVDKPGGGLEDDLVRLLARVEALTVFLESDDGADLLTAYKRAANIVAIEEKKDKQSYDGEADPKLFAQGEETALHASLGASMKASSVALKGEDFTAVMGELAKLRAPVDAFFDEVTVNCDDPKLRRNRLRLLSQIRATLGNVADFSRIEG